MASEAVNSVSCSNIRIDECGNRKGVEQVALLRAKVGPEIRCHIRTFPLVFSVIFGCRQENKCCLNQVIAYFLHIVRFIIV